MTRDTRPLIVHVVHAFDVGGLENGVANLVNHLPRDRYRHAIVALTQVTSFRDRVLRDDVEFIALDKSPGHSVKLYPRIHALMRALRPAIVHTRNLAALEVSVPAAVAGVPIRVHGEHGRDVGDLDGSSRRHQWIRRLYRPFVTHYVALSRDLSRYLAGRVGVPESRISQIYNGVDTARFAPAPVRSPVAGCPFIDPQLWVMGSVGRMQAVKDPLLLARAFIAAIEGQPALKSRLRLAMVGDGPLRADVLATLASAGLANLAWLPGERADVPDVLRSFDAFMLPSLAEGISNTILEAMACGLPVTATDVGGNGELVDDGVTGRLVPAGNAQTLAEAIIAEAGGIGDARRRGAAGRARVEQMFSLGAMVEHYQALYDALLARHRPQAVAGRAASPTLPLAGR